MKKKEYIKPVTTIIGMQAYGSMLAGSFDNVADSKENSFDSDLWDNRQIPIGLAIAIIIRLVLMKDLRRNNTAMPMING